MKKEDLYSVEIIGGSSRVPCFKSAVKEVFGLEPSTTLNTDEAAARGAALKCRVRKSFELLDKLKALNIVFKFKSTKFKFESIIFKFLLNLELTPGASSAFF